MTTYSKYDKTDYQTLSGVLRLSDIGTQSYSFLDNFGYTGLIDNDNHLIYAKDIRSSILSLWDSIVFKQTTIQNMSYIGIDTGATTSVINNPTKDSLGRDLKSKIYFGKRNYGDSEIMDDYLLSSDVDIFLYNTKTEGKYVSQETTKVVFLSGKNTLLHKTAPYIESQVILNSDNTKTISMDIINDNGDISFLSKRMDLFNNDVDGGGTVSVNDIVFPSYDSSKYIDINDPILGASATDGRILSLNDNNLLSWIDIELPNADYIGTTGSSLNIYGDETLVNGYALDFTDNRYCPIEIGDILPGMTFSSESIVKVLEKIIYDYLPPLCSLSISTEYVEVGSYPDVRLYYTITKRTNNTLPTLLTNMIPNSYPAISSYNHTHIVGSASAIIIKPVEKSTTVFTIKVNDGVQSNIATASVSGIYPYFYGFTSSNTITSYGLGDLNKLVEYRGNKTIDLIGSGNFYFIYDANYGDLTEIIDSFGDDILNDFELSTMTLSSPTGLWAVKQFKVYKWSNQQVGPPSENFSFNYT
jgi:hypothetical protein